MKKDEKYDQKVWRMKKQPNSSTRVVIWLIKTRDRSEKTVGVINSLESASVRALLHDLAYLKFDLTNLSRFALLWI